MEEVNKTIEIDRRFRHGKLYGHEVYIDIKFYGQPYNIGMENQELEKCRNFFEKSFKHADFIDQLKEIFHS